MLGVDIKKFSVPRDHCDDRVVSILADAYKIDHSTLRNSAPNGYSAILSDMCPSTSGNDSTDVARSLSLGERALELAIGDFNSEFGHLHDPRFHCDTDSIDSRTHWTNGPLLKSGGNLVIKVLEGEGMHAFNLERYSIAG